MINGTFDFFFAAGDGSGAEGAGAWTAGPGCTTGTSAVTFCCWAGGGGAGGGVAATGGGGGGAGGGAAGGRAMSEVFGVPVGPVVGPVLRGNATVAG